MAGVSTHISGRCKVNNRVLQQARSSSRGIWHSHPRARAMRCNVAVSEGSVREEKRFECHLDVWRAPHPSRMISDGRAFEEEHRIRGYEVGPNRRATMMSIANLLQEVGSNHAVWVCGRSDKGFAIDPEMAEEGLIFVMTRMQIQMDSYPSWGEIVQIETWCKGSWRMRAQRDWVVRNSDGIEIGRATSTWVTISLKTRRPLRLPVGRWRSLPPWTPPAS